MNLRYTPRILSPPYQCLPSQTYYPENSTIELLLILM